MKKIKYELRTDNIKLAIKVLLGVVVFLYVIYLNNNPRIVEPSQSSVNQVDVKLNTAQKIAKFDGFMAYSDLNTGKVAHIEDLLYRLKAKHYYQNIDYDRIAEIAFKVKGYLKSDKGLDFTMTEVLELLDNGSSIEAQKLQLKLEDIGATLVMLTDRK